MIEKDPALDLLIRGALKEDIGPRDLASSLVPLAHTSKGDCIFKEDGILCGISIAEKVFRLIDDNIRFLPAAKDGELIEKGRVIFYIEGPTRQILSAERTALNFLGRMCGIATLTRAFVERVEGTRARIYDTRKTTPNFRKIERYAVHMGGGHNHRFGLFDGMLIKDNHLRALQGIKIKDIYRLAKEKAPKTASVGMEVKTIDQAKEALGVTFDYVLLDNFTVDMVRQVVEHRSKAVSSSELEVSGGINLSNIRAYAETGIERISIGAVTHSAHSLDLSLNLI